MKTLTLNLASRPFRNNRAIGTALVSVSALLLVATVANLYVFFTYRSSYAQLQRDQRAERTRLESLEKEDRRLAKEIESRDFAAAYRRGRFAGGVILQQDFSWTRLFNKLEELMPDEVMMTSIRPNITGDGIVIRVDGVAKDQIAFLTLQERLLEDASYTNVKPISERKINPRMSDIAFVATFDYLPESHAERESVVAAQQDGSAPEPSPSGTRPDVRTPSGTAGARAVPVQSQPVAVPGAVVGTVGRDGRERTPEVLARMIAVPGGVYLSRQQDDATGEAPAPAPKKKEGTRGKRPMPRTQKAGVQANAREETPPPPATTEGGTHPATAAKSGSNPGGAAGGAPEADRGAVRTNVPLKFVDRTIREVYVLLGLAHAVSFEIDPGVDRAARVTTDLTGMPLQRAIAELSRAAGHSIVQRQDGVYRVAALEGEAILADKPIREENLPAEEKP